jgi:hypothetical protein
VSALEARYRAALRWYPRAWRAENADAIVGVMLDQAEAEGRTAPARGELRNLLSSGVGQRVERYAPQDVRDRVATIALAIGVAYSLIMFVLSEWAPFATSGPSNDWMLPTGPAYRAPSSIGFGPFASVMVIVFAMWIVAFALVLLRFSRSATAVLLLTAPLLFWVRSVRSDDIGAMQPTTAALILIGALAALASVGRPARTGRRAVAAVTGATTIAIVTLMRVGGMAPLHDGRLVGYIYTFAVLHAPAIASVLVVAGVALAMARRRAWSTAALVVAAPWLCLSQLYFAEPTVLSLGIGTVLAGLCLVGGALVWSRQRASATAPSSRSS